MYFESHGHILARPVTTANIQSPRQSDLLYYALLAHFIGLPTTDNSNKNFVVPYSVLACKGPSLFQGYRRIPRRILHFGNNFETKESRNSNR